MSHQIWSAADGALLKDLREKASVEISMLAIKQCLSKNQIKQLEDGGDSSFYSPAIKFATGRKLLLHFGADVTPAEPSDSQPEQDLQPEPLPERVSEPVPDSVPDSVPAPKPTRAKVKLKPQPQPLLEKTQPQIEQNEIILDAPQREMDAQETPAVGSEKFSGYWRFLFPVAVAISLGIIFVNLPATRLKKQSNSEDFVAQTAVAPPIEAIASEPKSIVQSVPTDAPTVAPTVVPTVALTPSKTPSVAPAQCNWSDESMPLVGFQPNKSGDYVHIVANTDSSVCVKDASNTLQVLQLKSGQSQTVRGRPPFAIYSQQLHQFKFFYQGNLLRPPSNDIQNITLKEQKYE